MFTLYLQHLNITRYRIYLPGHVCLLQVLLSSEFPSQLLPNMHLLRRVSVPRPHVTEQVHDPHDDQARNKNLSDYLITHQYFIEVECSCDLALWFICYHWLISNLNVILTRTRCFHTFSGLSWTSSTCISIHTSSCPTFCSTSTCHRA